MRFYILSAKSPLDNYSKKLNFNWHYKNKIIQQSKMLITKAARFTRLITQISSYASTTSSKYAATSQLNNQYFNFYQESW
jgi:hypothetical protein